MTLKPKLKNHEILSQNVLGECVDQPIFFEAREIT